MKMRLVPALLLLAAGCAQKVDPVSPLATAGASGPGGNPFGYGDHLGEMDSIDVKVNYLNTYFWTDDNLAGYYIGLPMTVEVTISNTGPRTLSDIDMRMSLEYLEGPGCDRWWYPNADGSTWVPFNTGDPLPGDTQATWSQFSLAPGQSLVFTHSYTIPYETCSGNDSVHIELRHHNDGPWHAAKFYDNPLQSVFDPPPASAD